MTEQQSDAVRPRLQPLGGLTQAAAILIGAATILSAAVTWRSWASYNLVADYVAGEAGVTEADLNAADRVGLIVVIGYGIATLAAGVVFMVWLWRARRNAEALVPDAEHRRSRGWIIGGWVCPVVNLWFPYMIVDDVYRASRPGNPRDLYNLRAVPGSGLLGGWWATLLVSFVLNRLADSEWRDAATVESLHTSVVNETLALASFAAAAVLIIVIMRRISFWQSAG